MAWCRQASSHYVSQCWPRSLSPYGVTRPKMSWAFGLHAHRAHGSKNFGALQKFPHDAQPIFVQVLQSLCILLRKKYITRLCHFAMGLNYCPWQQSVSFPWVPSVLLIKTAKDLSNHHSHRSFWLMTFTVESLQDKYRTYEDWERANEVYMIIGPSGRWVLKSVRQTVTVQNQFMFMGLLSCLTISHCVDHYKQMAGCRMTKIHGVAMLWCKWSWWWLVLPFDKKIHIDYRNCYIDRYISTSWHLILAIVPMVYGSIWGGDNWRTVNASANPHISDQLGTEYPC